MGKLYKLYVVHHERVDALEELTEVDTQNMRINEWIAEHMGLIRLSCYFLVCTHI